MSEYEDDMDRSQNTDLCVLLIVKNCDYMTCEIVVSLIDFIFEKKHVCLQRFSFLARLFWLNCTFKCFKYIFMKSENITLRQSFISTTFEYTLNVVEIKDCLNVIFSDFIKMYLKHLNVQFSQKSLARKENLCRQTCFFLKYKINQRYNNFTRHIITVFYNQQNT